MKTVYSVATSRGLAAILVLFVPLLPGCLATVGAEEVWQSPLATQALLLDIVRAGEQRMYAVGERGHVLRYEPADGWSQQTVPSRVLLTAVDFQTTDHGCAVGHDAVIVCTWNGGRDWHLVHQDPQLEAPLLDVLFLSAEKIVAVGAYSLYLFSEDGGRSWQRRKFSPAAADRPVFTEAAGQAAGFATGYDPHLNAITRLGTDRLYIAAEAGRLFESSDGGDHWRVLPSPYRGSWFGVSVTADDSVLVYGLRGHLYRLPADGSLQWRQAEHAGGEQLTDTLALTAGSRLVIGHGGTMLYRAAGEDGYRLVRFPGRPALQAAAFMPPDSLFFASDRGILQLSLARLQKELLRERDPD